MDRSRADDSELPAAEAARTRARDRRRRTRMVVDNAGVRRILIDRLNADRSRTGAHPDRSGTRRSEEP